MAEIETGDPSVSFGNVESLINAHGLLIGAIHMVAPSGESITNLYFFRGYVHTATGFDLPKNQDSPKGLAFVMALGNISGWNMTTDLPKFSQLGFTDFEKETLKNGKNIYYIFRASRPSSYVNSSVGSICMVNAIALLEERKDGEFIEI